MDTLRNLELAGAAKILIDEVVDKAAMTVMHKHGVEHGSYEEVKDFMGAIQPFLHSLEMHVTEKLVELLEHETNCVSHYLSDFHTGMIVHGDASKVIETMSEALFKED